MSFITETGAGIAGATSYLSLEDADAHFAALARQDWTDAITAARQNALMQASLYVDSYDYPGTVLSPLQGLKWPRSGARDAEGRALSGLPHALRVAVLELAAEYISAPPDALEGRQTIKEKVGPMELVFSSTKRQPSFVFRLLLQIGARPRSLNMSRTVVRG